MAETCAAAMDWYEGIGIGEEGDDEEEESTVFRGNHHLICEIKTLD